MLVNEMKSTFLRIGAQLFAAFYETAICLLTFSLKLLSQRIMVLVKVECEKVSSGIVLATGGASVRMLFSVMELKSINGREFNHVSMRR